jgi:hypothetical protein
VGLRLQVVLLTLYPEALTHVLTTLSDAALKVRTVLREEVTPPPPLHPLPLGHRLDLPPSRGGGSVGLGPSPSAIEEGEGPTGGLRVVQQTINVSCAALSLFVTKVWRRRIVTCTMLAHPLCLMIHDSPRESHVCTLVASTYYSIDPFY